jgi:hypothetical protein
MGKHMDQDLLDIQIIRLLKAFFRIEDAETRKILLAITEAAARGASVKAEVFSRIAQSRRAETKLH